MNSTSTASDAGSGRGAGFTGAAADFAAVGFATTGAAGFAAAGADGRVSADSAGLDASVGSTGEVVANFPGAVATGTLTGTVGGSGASSSPAGTDARGTGGPGGSLCTRAVAVPIVSAGFANTGGAAALAAEGIAGSGETSTGFAIGAVVVVAAAAATGSAVTVEPVADFARATGVLSSPFVEAITAEPDVIALTGLGAGAPASGFFGGAGLNESRIFSAATQSWARICGICSKTVSAGSRSFIKRGMRCWSTS